MSAARFVPLPVLRSLVLAAGLAAGALAAVPAQAQQHAGFSFSLDLGNGATVSVGARQPAPQLAQYHHGRDRGRWDRNDYRPQLCLSDRDIHRQLRQYGYDDVRLGRERRGVLEATGQHRGWVYSMEIERCSGRVSRVRELHPIPRADRRGLGLHFHLGN